jgi:predicted ester cyclase
MPIDTTSVTTQVLDQELTTNVNYLQPTGFRVVIDRVKYPNLEFFAQTVTHPGASLPPTELPTTRITSVPLAGDKMSFSELSLSLILDENMSSYEEMYDWMVRIVNEGQKSASFRDEGFPTFADITVMVLSSHNNSVKKIKYKDCVPTDLGAIDFQSTTGDVQYLTFTASFRFTQFELL